MSIYKTAEAANVSIATVSRFINGGCVSVKTASKLKEIIKSNGYSVEVNRPGRKNSKRTGIRTGVIIFLSVGRRDARVIITQPTYARLISNVMQVLNENSMNIMFMHIPDGKVIPQKLSSKHCDGVIIFGRETNLSQNLKTRLKSIPSVWCFNHGVDVHNLDMDQIVFNNASVGPIAVDYFAKRKHKNIAYVSHDKNSQISSERGLAFLTAAKEKDLKASIINSDCTGDYTCKAANVADQILAHENLTGLAFYSDSFMLAVFNQLRDKNCNISKFDLLGCNNTEQILQLFSQSPPSIDVHFEKIGRVSAKMLFKRINSQNNKESEIKMFEPKIELKEKK